MPVPAYDKENKYGGTCMGDEQRCLDCCERECKDKCFQKCCCDRDRDRCDRDFCDDDGGNIIWLLIILLVVYCLFCNNNNRRGGLFGGLF